MFKVNSILDGLMKTINNKSTKSTSTCVHFVRTKQLLLIKSHKAGKIANLKHKYKHFNCKENKSLNRNNVFKLYDLRLYWIFQNLSENCMEEYVR